MTKIEKKKNKKSSYYYYHLQPLYLINTVTPNTTSLLSQIKSGAQPIPNNVSPGTAGQREPCRTADVSGRQHPGQTKPEAVICL